MLLPSEHVMRWAKTLTLVEGRALKLTFKRVLIIKYSTAHKGFILKRIDRYFDSLPISANRSVISKVSPLILAVSSKNIWDQDVLSLLSCASLIIRLKYIRNLKNLLLCATQPLELESNQVCARKRTIDALNLIHYANLLLFQIKMRK